MNDELLISIAIMEANEIVDNMSEDDLKCFVFDRLVEEIMDGKVQEPDNG